MERTTLTYKTIKSSNKVTHQLKKSVISEAQQRCTKSIAFTDNAISLQRRFNLLRNLLQSLTISKVITWLVILSGHASLTTHSMRPANAVAQFSY